MPDTLPFTAKALDKRRLSLWPDKNEEEMGLRMRRAISWITRAEKEIAVPDYDAACVFYWIAFNAAYAQDIPETGRKSWTTSEEYKRFVETILQFDTGRTIASCIFEENHEMVLLMLEDQYVYKDFWLVRNGSFPAANWQNRFEKEVTNVRGILRGGDSRRIREVLPVVFDRLYVLRNQLMHGGATWCSSVNREQVQRGAEVLAFLVPRFVALMLQNHSADWGPCFYRPSLQEKQGGLQHSMI